MVDLQDNACDEMWLPLEAAECVLSAWGLEPTSPKTSDGHIRYWETVRPYSAGVVLHVLGGAINVVDLADALQRRGVDLDEVQETIDQCLQSHAETPETDPYR